MLNPSTPPLKLGIACGAKVASTPARRGLSSAEAQLTASRTAIVGTTIRILMAISLSSCFADVNLSLALHQ
jgi:hypothetical protein